MSIYQVGIRTDARAIHFFLNQLSLHDRYLTGGTAEGNEAKLQPKTKSFDERWTSYLIMPDLI